MRHCPLPTPHRHSPSRGPSPSVTHFGDSLLSSSCFTVILPSPLRLPGSSKGSVLGLLGQDPPVSALRMPCHLHQDDLCLQVMPRIPPLLFAPLRSLQPQLPSPPPGTGRSLPGSPGGLGWEAEHAAPVQGCRCFLLPWNKIPSPYHVP